MKSQPFVTVFIPTFNYGQYIENAIDSVLGQTYPGDRIEIIIVDDGSTDGTADVVSRYGDRVTYIFQSNQGKAASTAKALELARGEYFFNLDADDFYEPTCVASAVAGFQSDREVSQVSWLRYRWSGAEESAPVAETHYEAHGTMVIDGDTCIRKYLANKRRVVLGSGFAGDTKILKAAGVPHEVDMFVDLYLFLVAASRGKVFLLNEPLCTFRRHPMSYSEGEVSFESSERKAKRYEKSALAILETARDIPVRPASLKLLRSFYLEYKIDTQVVQRVFCMKTMASYFYSLLANFRDRRLSKSWSGFVLLGKRVAVQVLTLTGLRAASR